MTTLEQAREFIADRGEYLSSVGDQLDGWTVISREYVWFKYTRVHFTIVAADPDGQLWQYTITESTADGTEVSGDPLPVTAVTETKPAVVFTPRLVPRQSPTGPSKDDNT
ncbi:hypothetical protein [Mycolicibacterium sp.]|uniref:hypothetical protein n=1 Tax=Mycolicibacterium sp. TaxID=2320850 RepID=UPI00355CCEDB